MPCMIGRSFFQTVREATFTPQIFYLTHHIPDLSTVPTLNLINNLPRGESEIRSLVFPTYFYIV